MDRLIDGCARQQSEVIKTVERLEKRLQHITTPLTVSVIGASSTVRTRRARPTSASPAAATAFTKSISAASPHCLKDADIVDRGVGREKGRGDRGARQRERSSRQPSSRKVENTARPRAPAFLQIAAAYSASGKRMMKPSRFGIFTLGKVSAFIVSLSPMSLFSARI